MPELNFGTVKYLTAFSAIPPYKICFGLDIIPPSFGICLTDKEKEFLEEVMGLEYNTLSIYKKVSKKNMKNLEELTIRFIMIELPKNNENM